MKWPIDPRYLRGSYILRHTIFLKYHPAPPPPYLRFLFFICNHNSMPWHIKSCFNVTYIYLYAFPISIKVDDGIYVLSHYFICNIFCNTFFFTKYGKNLNAVEMLQASNMMQLLKKFLRSTNTKNYKFKNE